MFTKMFNLEGFSQLDLMWNILEKEWIIICCQVSHHDILQLSFYLYFHYYHFDLFSFYVCYNY